jgi:hypothetical protein
MAKKKAKERRKERRQQQAIDLTESFKPFRQEYNEILEGFRQGIKYSLYGGDPLPDGMERESPSEYVAKAFKLGRKMKKAGWPNHRVFIPFYLHNAWNDGWESLKRKPYRTIDDP